jgi:O-antigen ligase
MPFSSRLPSKTEFDDSNIWGLVVSAWLCFMILFGGVSTPANWALVIQSIMSASVLALGIWRLRKGFNSKSAVVGAAIAAGSLMLTLLQLVPLPYSLWAGLPGHQLNVDTFSLLGAKPGWLPLSLSPLSTKASALALIPALAGYFAVLTLRATDYLRISLVVVACAVIGLVIGLAQKSLGQMSGFYFYGDFGINIANGTFANRNFFAAQLFTSIPFVAAIATVMSHSRRVHPALVLIFAFIYMALLVVGLGIIGSRGGIVLAILSVIFSVFYVYRNPITVDFGRRWSFYAVLTFLVLIFQVGMVGITRLAETDPIQDYRGEIYGVTLTTIKNYFPVGSGMGTFAPVYQQFETPRVIVAKYVNHAHNDWLEIALEGGAPALGLLGAFVLLYLRMVVSVSRMASNVAQHAFYRAALVAVFLLLVHALVDFGLRTPALMSFFSICCGIVVTSRARSRTSGLHVKGNLASPKESAASRSEGVSKDGYFKKVTK